MKCYIHTKTLKIVCMPDLDEFGYDEEYFVEEREFIEEEWPDIEEIEKMPSSEAFRVMEDFAGLVADRKLQNRLINAFEKRKPFRHFKFEVENSVAREEWFKYRDERNYDWVLQQVRRLEQKIKEKSSRDG